MKNRFSFVGDPQHTGRCFSAGGRDLPLFLGMSKSTYHLGPPPPFFRGEIQEGKFLDFFLGGVQYLGLYPKRTQIKSGKMKVFVWVAQKML